MDWIWIRTLISQACTKKEKKGKHKEISSTGIPFQNASRQQSSGRGTLSWKSIGPKTVRASGCLECLDPLKLVKIHLSNYKIPSYANYLKPTTRQIQYV